MCPHFFHRPFRAGLGVVGTGVFGLTDLRRSSNPSKGRVPPWFQRHHFGNRSRPPHPGATLSFTSWVSHSPLSSHAAVIVERLTASCTGRLHSCRHKGLLGCTRSTWVPDSYACSLVSPIQLSCSIGHPWNMGSKRLVAYAVGVEPTAAGFGVSLASLGTWAYG